MISKLAVAGAGAALFFSTGLALADWDWPADREHGFYERFSEHHFREPTAGFNVTVGGVVPGEVELYDAPADFDYAPARTYKYVIYQKRIYVVEPRTRKVIRIIER